MKKKITPFRVTLVAVSLIVFVSGCKDDTSSPPDSSADINYNAAYVVNAGSNSISVIDLTSNTVRRTIMLSNISWPHHVNINPGRTHIALGVPGMDLSGGHGGMMGMPGKICVLNAVTGEVTKLMDIPVMNHNASFSPDGTEIWTSQMDSMGSVLVYDANSFTLKNTIMVGMMPQEITFSADGSMGFAACGMSDSVYVIDVMTKGVMAVIPVGMNPVGAWPGSNNKMYVDNEEGQSITVIDVATMAVEETVSLGFTPGYAAYHSQLNELWVSDDTNGRIVYFQRMSNEWMNMGNIMTGAGAHAIAFSTDGAFSYVTNQMAGTVSVINTSSKAKVKDISVGTKPNGIALKQ